MIFYFSGTGNSKWVAATLATAFNDKIVAMADYFNKGNITIPKFDLSETEYVGFVFPVHSWGVPNIVRNFIENLQLNSYHNQLIYGIFTCGDDCGLTKDMFLEILKNKSLQCRHIYSVQMPNTYIVFPGFDVDSQRIEARKKRDAAALLPQLIEAIKSDKPVDKYIKGHFSYIKSRVIYPQFCKHAMSSKPFYTTEACNGCGKCARQCPTKNIVIVDGKPKWDNYCTQCLSCIHRCPTRAIEYGKLTRKKGRYFFNKD